MQKRAIISSLTGALQIKLLFVFLVFLATTVALLCLCVSLLFALPIPPKIFHSSWLRSKLINYLTVKPGAK